MNKMNKSIVCIAVCSIMVLGSIGSVLGTYKTPNDTYWQSGDLWNMEDSFAQQAWDLDEDNSLTHTGSNSITIAVLDSGLRWDPVNDPVRHDDISKDLVWRNWNETVGDANGDGYPGIEDVDDDGDGLVDEDADGNPAKINGQPNPNWDPDSKRDDDENGYYDDMYGYNCIKEIKSGLDDDLYDNGWWVSGTGEEKEVRENHGTQITGYIGAMIDNGGEGICGVSPDVKIMILKIFDGEYQFFNSDDINTYYNIDKTIEDALQYAIDNGADIITMAWDLNPSTVEFDTELEEAYDDNICLISSSGSNGGQMNLGYPAKNSYVIGVGAVDSGNPTKRASDSRYTLNTPPYYAPWNGVEICGRSHDVNDDDIVVCNGVAAGEEYEFLTDGEYSAEYAVPLVAATAGLILSYQPSLTNREVRKVLHVTADDVLKPDDNTEYPGFDKFTGFGVVNIAEALRAVVHKKPEFLQGYAYTNPQHLIEAPRSNPPVSGYEPAIAIDCNGYIHAVTVQEYNDVQEICYIQLNPNMDLRVNTVRIEDQQVTQPWDSFDPAISVDKDEKVHIVWREEENLQGALWHIALKVDGTIVPNSFSNVLQGGWKAMDHLNLVSSRTRSCSYIVYETPDAANGDYLQMIKINSNGALVDIIDRQWVPPPGGGTPDGYYHPSADICFYEGVMEDIVVMHEHTDYNNGGDPSDDETGIGFWLVRDTGVPNHLDVSRTLPTYWPPPATEFIPKSVYIDPDVDVAYHGISGGKRICGVFRQVPFSTPQVEYYANLKYISIDDANPPNFLTYEKSIMDITDTLQPVGWGGTPRYCFNPQIAINRWNEARVVYEEHDHLSSVAIKLDGRQFHGKWGSSHREYYSDKPYTWEDYNDNLFRFSFPQVISTDLSYPNGRDPFDHDLNFHSAYLRLEEPNAPPNDRELRFETTRQFGNDAQNIGPGSVSDHDPDIACDDFDGKHVVWTGQDGMGNWNVYYSYYDDGLDIGKDLATIGPLALGDTSKDPDGGQVAVSTDDTGKVVVHVVWHVIFSTPPPDPVILRQLRYTQIIIDPVNPLNSQYNPPPIDDEEVDGCSLTHWYEHVRIASVADYAPKTLTDPEEYYEFLFITYKDGNGANPDGDVYLLIIDWDNDFQAEKLVSDSGTDPEIDVDSEGNAYIVYCSGRFVMLSKWEFTPVNSWARPTGDGVFDGSDVGVMLPDTTPPNPLFEAYKPKLKLDRITDRRDGGDFKNVMKPYIHILYDGVNDETLTGGHHLYYIKYDSYGHFIFDTPRVVFPPNAQKYNYYSNIPIASNLSLTRDNEVVIVFSAEIETDKVNGLYGYDWYAIDQQSFLWMTYVTNNGKIHSNPVFINPDHTWDCTYAEVAVTSDNTFNIVYALGPNWNLNHVRGITSSQNTKFYNINEP